MTTFAVADDGDLAFGEEGLSIADGLQAIEQQVRQRLRFNRGESFLRADQGVPWFTQVLGDNSAGLGAIAIERELRSVHGVDAVRVTIADVSPETRRLSLQVTVTAVGETVQIEESF